MRRLSALVCLLLLVTAFPALAAPQNLSYSIWNVSGGSVRVLFMLPESSRQNVAAAGSPTPTTKQLADYVLTHVAVMSRGKPCEPVDQGEEVGLVNTLALTPGLLRFEIVFECANETGLTLVNTAFSDQQAKHLDFARVQIDGGGFTEHVFTAEAPRLDLPAGGDVLRSDSIRRYAALGFDHVLGRADILCFMLALLLIARRRRDYVMALGALIAGYALSTLLSAFYLAAPRFGTGQGFSGLLLLLAAVTGMAMCLRDPRRGALALGAGTMALAILALFLHGAIAAGGVLGAGLLTVSPLFFAGRGRRRVVLLLVIAFLFALVDGFTLSGDVAVLALPAAPLAFMLTGFNAAALTAEVALPLCLLAACLLMPKIRQVLAPRGPLFDVAASILIGCGVFWFATWQWS